MRGYAIRRGASWRYSCVSSGGKPRRRLIPSRHGFLRLPAQPLSRRAIRASGLGYWGTVFEAAVAVVLTVAVDAQVSRGVSATRLRQFSNMFIVVVVTNFPTAQVETWRRSGHLDTAGNDWKKASLRLKNVSFLRFCCVPLDRSRNTERAEPLAVACASDSGQCAAHALKPGGLIFWWSPNPD